MVRDWYRIECSSWHANGNAGDNSFPALLHWVLFAWLGQEYVLAKPPTLQILKEVLSGVELYDVASDLEQRFSDLMDKQLPMKKTAGAQMLTGSLQDQSFSGSLGHKISTNAISTPPITGLAQEISKPAQIVHKRKIFDTVFAEYRQGPMDIYKAQPELPEDSWPPVSHGTFINLALIKQTGIKDSNEYARYTIQGDIDDVLDDKYSIEYDNVFSDLSSGARLLIEGRPGSGKTTFVHKVSRDWANGKLHLKDVQLLFLVHLRLFFSDPDVTIHDIIKQYYLLDSTVSQIEKYTEEYSGKGLCFILDGLDEYTPKRNGTPVNDNVIFKLIRKELLPKALVIVASRPAALAHLRRKASKRVETLGFLKAEIREYVKHYKFSDPAKTDGLFTYLRLHPNVMHMCYLPIHTAMVCYLYEEMGNALPRTETEMYQQFTNLTLLRALLSGGEKFRHLPRVS